MTRSVSPDLDLQLVAEALADVGALVRRLVPTGDLSLVALTTLKRLSELGGQRIGELADREGVSQPGMTQLISRLADQGLVERRADAGDGRAVLVDVTESGRALLTEVRRNWVHVLADRLSALSDDEAALLRTAVPALRHFLSTA